MSLLPPEGRPPARWEVNAAPRVRLYMFQPCEPEAPREAAPAPEGLPPGADPHPDRPERAS